MSRFLRNTRSESATQKLTGGAPSQWNTLRELVGVGVLVAQVAARHEDDEPVGDAQRAGDEVAGERRDRLAVARHEHAQRVALVGLRSVWAQARRNASWPSRNANPARRSDAGHGRRGAGAQRAGGGADNGRSSRGTGSNLRPAPEALACPAGRPAVALGRVSGNR